METLLSRKPSSGDSDSFHIESYEPELITDELLLEEGTWDDDDWDLAEGEILLEDPNEPQEIVFDLLPLHPLIPKESWNNTASGPVSGTTGIDTLKLFFPVRAWRRPDFRVIPGSKMRSPDASEGVLWCDPQGEYGYGAMAVRRIGPFRFRIAPVGTDVKLRAFFSAPSAAYGNNSCAITRSDLRRVMEEMQATLYDLGLEVDWREGQVSRLDVHRDVALPRPFRYYLPALQQLAPPYGRLFQNYPTSVLRGAATKLVYALYDKRAERSHRNGPTPPETQQWPGWLRCEARLMTAATVQERLGLGTAAKVVSGFDSLAPWMDERIRHDLFNGTLPTLAELNFKEPDDGCEERYADTLTPDDEEWWRLQLRGTPAGLKDRLAYIGLRLASAMLGPEQFWKVARQECCDTTLNASKFRSHFRQVALESFSDEGLPIAYLYDQLRQILLTRP